MTYGIAGRAFAITMCFLLSRSTRVVFYGQSSEAREMNVDIPQSSLIGPTSFLLAINDLARNIDRSLVNMYADDPTVYKCTSKTLDDQNKETDFTSDLALTAK